jgi:predicted HTH transcriptional regulator
MQRVTIQPRLEFDVGEMVRMGADVCENRHRGNVESVLAHEKIVARKSKDYDVILKFYSEVGKATSHEVVAGTGIPLQTVSARLSELKRKLHRLKTTGQRKNGAAVLEMVQ